MKTWHVPLADLDIGDEEKQAVLAVLDRRWLTMGEITGQFEDNFARAMNVNYAFAVSNATAALHMACLALGIGAGDEVIVPSLSFVATANAVLYTGAQVRFADITGPQELTISPDDIERQITPRTKAIIVMHYAGFPCRMYDILEIASRHNIAVIEDAAHATGASLDGRALGVWGDIGCYSFFSNKNLVTGEGGMLVTDRADVAERVRRLRSHGMTSLTWDRHQGHAYTYDVTAIGYNYRIDEIRSALGLVQLEKLHHNNNLRKSITERYWDGLQDSGLVLPFRHMQAAQNTNIKPAYHIFPILLPQGHNRQQFMQSLQANGIQTSIHYPPIHQFSYYRTQYPGIMLPKTESIAARQVTLPLYPTMSDEQVSLVINAVKETLPISQVRTKV